MNFYITNLSNTYNYGSMMMGEVLITFLNSKFPNSNFYIDAKKNEHVERLKEACEYGNIFLDKIFDIKLITNKIKGVRRIERKIKDNLSYKKCSKFYDAVFVLGGDDFSEIYCELPRDNFIIFNTLKQIENINNGTKLYMIGQTIGPYSGERLEYAKHVFNKIKIYSRDETSTEYLKENGIKVNVSRDLAFIDLNLQNKLNYKDILKKYNLEKDEYITIVGTGLFRNYETNEKNMVKIFNKVIKYLREKYPNKKIIWLSHVTKYNPSDCNMLEHFNKEIFDLVIDEIILPVEARLILGNGYFTLTCRMHAAVSTFKMGKPAICLSYSSKYNGVIARGLDMKDLVIEAKNEKLWKTNLDKIINEKIDYVENNYDNLKNKIKKEVTKCEKLAEKMLDEIVEDIKKENI